MHKQMCASFKGNMTHLADWSLHAFPFSFYPKDKPFCSYNLVTLLVNHGLHNVGIFRRLCHCYQSTAFGELGGERMAQIAAAEVTDPWDKFETLGLTKEWFPLSKPLVDARKITGWKELYAAKGIPTDDVGCLVFDHVMTVWHLLNKFVLDGITAKDGMLLNCCDRTTDAIGHQV